MHASLLAAGGTTAPTDVRPVAGGLEVQPEAAVEDDIADEEVDEDLIHSSTDDADSEA